MIDKRSIISCLLLSAGIILFQLSVFGAIERKIMPSKKVVIPKGLGTIPEHNDFNSNTAEYSNKRRAESNDFVIFWSKEYGDNPMINTDAEKIFDVDLCLKECERFYDYYVNNLKIVTKGKSVTDSCKIIILITGGDNKTAYGWGKDNVGVVWTPASRINKFPYGVLAHELGHAFQYLSGCDYGTNFNGPVNEMGAQYMLWQVYPEWMTFENYHLKAYLNKTYYAFLHPENQYHSPYVIEYWSGKHGRSFYGKLLHSVKKGEDMVTTYKRIAHINQQQFNDEMFDAACHFVSWDLKRIKKLAQPYANQHTTKLSSIGDGWYQTNVDNSPQNYGYNAVRLEVPKSRSTIILNFKGACGAKGFRNIKIEDAGWRYGFVAINNNGNAIYGKMYSADQAKITYRIPAHTKYLWLVVSGAPKHHSPVSRKENNNPHWPYKFKLINTHIYH